MEDALYLYGEPYYPHARWCASMRPPPNCWPRSLTNQREPLPAQPGRPRRQDYEYRRAGARNLFLTCEPRASWRVRPLTNRAITERRTMADFAHQMQWLVDVALP